MKRNVVKEKSFDFPFEVVNVYKILCYQQKEFVMSKQLLRSGTSIGANIREAEHAESKADFIHNIAIALKEANETEYWIELLYKSNYLNAGQFQNIHPKITEQLRLLTSILNTAKQK